MSTAEKLAILDREVVLAKQLHTQVLEELEAWRREIEFGKRVESIIADAAVAAEASTNRLAALRAEVAAGKV